MIRRLCLLVVAILLSAIGLAALSFTQVSTAGAQEPAPDAVPGEIIIAFNIGVGEASIRSFNRRNGLREKEDLTGASGGNRGRTKLVTVPGNVDRGLLTRLSRDP